MHHVFTPGRVLAAFLSLTVAAFTSCADLGSTSQSSSASGSTTGSATSYKFQFGAAQAASGYTLVPLTAVYSAGTGYGFEPGAAVTAVTGNASDPLQRGAITSAQPYTFSVAVPEGSYRVTVTLGDPHAESTVTVKAEARRLMLEHLKIPAGKFETRTFTVNIRNPKISTGGEVILDSREWNFETHQAISRGWDDKLTLAFSDTHPAVAAIQIEKMTDPVTLFILGDSTVTDQGGGGSSWGQMATRWFKAPVVVANHAESGETLKGFLKERRWEKVLDSMKAGDYVIIEFGTNDSKSSGPQNMYPNQDFAETYAPANTTYKELLKRFAADAQKKGAFPIIVSPSARRQDNLSGPGSLSAYAIAAMATAKEIGVPSIDLNTMGRQINTALGDEAPKQFGDQTHHVDYGAYLQSKCIVLGIQQAKLPLAKYIVDDFSFDPTHPQPTPSNFQVPADPRPAGAGRGNRAGGGPANAAPAN
jgi:lysophospholipase L1-like esterase